MKERYTKTKWVDGKTCVNAANLNKIESGIENLYRNAVGESQLQGGDGISLNKDPMTGNITIGIKEENDLISSSAVGRIEVVNSMPADPDPNCMYFVKDLNTGKFDLVFGGINLLSTISLADVPLAKLEGEVEVIDNGDGTFSVSYDGEEGIPEIVVYINGVPKEDPEDFVLVPGVNTFEVHVRIDGYEEIVEEYEIEYTPRTATPSIEYDSETYIVTVTGDGEIKFYIDGVLTELDEEMQYVFERENEEITHTLTATAQEENCEISNTATLEVTIPALPKLEGTGEISITAAELYSRELNITYDGDVPGVEISVEGEGIEEINNQTRNISKKIRLPEGLGPHTFTVTITAKGYQPWIYETSWELRGKREDPVITSSIDPETGDLTITVTSSTSSSITVNGVGDTFSGSYTVHKTYEAKHIIVLAQNISDSSTPYLDSSDQVQEEFDLEAKEKTPSQPAEFSFWLDVDGTKAYFTAEGPGVMLYADEADESEVRPIEFNRPALGEEDITISAHTYYAETKESGEQYEETITWYDEDIVIPAQEESTSAFPDVTEGDEAYTINFTGNVTRAYLNMTLVELPYVVDRLAEEDQTLTFIVCTKDDTKLEKETTLQVEVPRILVTETPVITTEEDDETVTVTASGEGNVTLTLVGYRAGIVENPYIIEKTNEPQTITFMAVAKAEGKLISSSVTKNVIVPKLILTTEAPTLNLSADGLTVTATGEGTVLLYIDGVLISGSTTYTFTKTDEQVEHIVTATAQESGKEISEVTTLEVTIPALVYAPEPTFNWAEQSLTMSAICENHEVVLMLGGNVVENPYQAEQEDETYALVFTAYTVAGQGEDVNSAEIESDEVSVPAIENYGDEPDEPEILTLEGNILVSKPTVEGIVEVSYSGGETVVFEITLNGQEQVGTEIQLVEGKNLLEVTVSASGYNSISEEYDLTWSPSDSYIEPDPEPDPEPLVDPDPRDSDEPIDPDPELEKS